MTLQLDVPTVSLGRVSGRTVALRRLVGLALVAVPLAWSWRQAAPEVNRGGVPLVADLLASALHPALSPDFLAVVLHACGTTVVYAALGTAGALAVGLLGGLALSDAAWAARPPRPVRVLRLLIRGLLVVTRSVHELVWALLLVSVLGLDPLIAVLAIAIPFGAQTAKVYGELLDGVPAGPQRALRSAGAPPLTALAYALFPAAAPLLLSYAFYRFECAIRSAVILGVVGVGGLGEELVVSLQSRNWDEVWTLIAAVLLLSAAVDLWSGRLRTDLAVVSCSDWSAGHRQARRSSRWARWSFAVAVPGVVLAWLASDVTLSGLTSPRTVDRTRRVLGEMWPPALPPDGWASLAEAVPDTVAMAVLAMAVAVVLTVTIGPWATRPRPAAGYVRRLTRWVARLLLLVLRSIPPSIWAVLALLALFPGVLPGALALGLYTGGILGRLVAEAWESIDTAPREALRRTGAKGWLASLAAIVPPSAHHLVTYTLYRFEICIRDTAVVGVVGAAGLGRLLAENLAAFRLPAVTTLLMTSVAVSIASELLGRRLTRALR